MHLKGGAGLVPEFCNHYKKKELREYREGLLADIEMTYDEYIEKYLRMRHRELMKLSLSLTVKKTLIKCNRAKPVKLTPGMILNESGEADRNKILGQSGRERERRDKRRNAIYRAIMTVFAGAIVINLILDFSWVNVAQWCVRMMPTNKPRRHIFSLCLIVNNKQK